MKYIADNFYPKEGEEIMKKALNAVVFYVLRNTQAYQAKRREVLSNRLHRIFFMDALEGQLDVIVRRKNHE